MLFPDPCEGVTCEFGARCEVNQITREAECACGVYQCTREYRPVCASDGRTYSSPCRLEETACREQQDISVEHVGECGQYWTLGANCAIDNIGNVSGAR